MPESFLGDGLIFEESLPFSWAPGPLPEATNLARLNAENHQLLAADSSLDEGRLHDALKEESPALVHELQRLDYKINVLLRLTADLARRQSGLPPARLAKMSPIGLEWVGADAPEIGSTGLLMLYVTAALPEALKLPAQVVGDGFQGNIRAAQLRFTGLSDPVVDLIEKFIFRHHRRMVAGSRQSSIPHA